jgi:drug/metabolite transporter (DMT)-like permease
MPQPGRALRADAALAGVVLVWGTTFVIVQRALQDASTLLFLAMRFTLAAVALALVFRGIRWSRAALEAGAWCGAALFAGFLLQTAGLRYTTPSKSAFITGLSVVFVPLLAAVFERRLPTRVEVAGVASATFGLALMTLDLRTLSMGYGDLLTLGCAAAYAVHILLVSHFTPRVGYRPVAVGQVATAATLALAGFWWAEPPMARWTPALLGAVALTGLLATAVAFSVMAWAQQHTSVVHTALIFSLEPVFAAAFSYPLSGEVLPPRGMAGAAMILGGVLLVELKPAEPQP